MMREFINKVGASLGNPEHNIYWCMPTFFVIGLLWGLAL